MDEYIFKIKYAAYNGITGIATVKPKCVGGLIRCKDCTHYRESELMCMMHQGDTDEWYDNDYCSRAERKEE